LATSKSADSSPVTSPIPPDSPVQRIWDNRCCEVQADQLLQSAVHPIERSRLLASRSSGSGDWLEAMPLSNIGLSLGPHAPSDPVGGHSYSTITPHGAAAIPIPCAEVISVQTGYKIAKYI
jgi:hypothetical protein